MAMEDSSMMSPADIAALTRGNTGFGGDGISWLVLILLFFGFMGGGWGGRYGNGELGQYATAASQQDILFGQHFGQINDRLTNIGNGVCSLGYDMQGNIGQLGKEIALGQANLQLQASNNTYALSNQLSNCCCETVWLLPSLAHRLTSRLATSMPTLMLSLPNCKRANWNRPSRHKRSALTSLNLPSKCAA